MSSSAPLSALIDDQEQRELDVEIHDVSGRVLRHLNGYRVLLGIARIVEQEDGRIRCPVCDRLFGRIDSVTRHIVTPQCRAAGCDDGFESESDAGDDGDANSTPRIERFVAAAQAITETVAAEESKFADLERRTDELRRMVSLAVARQRQRQHLIDVDDPPPFSKSMAAAAGST
jgi:hypothetical protein